MFSDQPIKNSAADLFDRKHFSNRIAQIIARRTDKESVVIGIHAPWGEGKTSVLNMIIESLDEYIHKKTGRLLDGHIVILKFNPWRFSDENQLLENFFSTLAEKLDEEIKTKGEKISETIKKYSGSLSPLEAVKVNILGVADAKLGLEDIVKKLTEIKPKADVNALKTRIEEILSKSSKKIVVIMDDIDRLDKDEIQSIFRLVKLTADFPNTVYILSFDTGRVSEALAERFGSKEAGLSFLEKIIQLSLPLPPITSSKLVDLTFSQINKLLDANGFEVPKDKDSDWSYFFYRNFSFYLKSPRLVNRYINNLWFSIPETKDELNIYDLLTIEAVHIFIPQLYESIRNNKDIFLLEHSYLSFTVKDEKENTKRLLEIIQMFPESDREFIKKIIQRLFPRTSGLLSNTSYGHDWDEVWTKEKKIASSKYFQRYFTVGISSDDLSDVEIANFTNNICSQNEQQNAATLNNLISNNRTRLFLEKLDLIVEDLGVDNVKQLAELIATSGNLFPRVKGEIINYSEFSHAASLIARLIKQIPNELEQRQFAVKIAEIASPLDFAYTYYDYVWDLGKTENEVEDRYKPSALGQSVLDKIVERIEVEAIQGDLDENYPQNSLHLYRAWLNERRDNAIKYLKQKFKKNPKEAEKFVLSFRRQKWEVNSVAKFWGFDFIISAIEKIKPNLKLIELEHYNEYSNFMVESDEQYLIYFISIAKKVKSQSKT